MSPNPFQHIDLRVNDIGAAVAFYEKLLPALGFSTPGGEIFRLWEGEGSGPYRPWFGMIEDREHRPNANRIAFAAADRAEVDRLAKVALEAGAANMCGPRACPEYGPTYYAAFFEDPSGNCLEICYTVG